MLILSDVEHKCYRYDTDVSIISIITALLFYNCWQTQIYNYGQTQNKTIGDIHLYSNKQTPSPIVKCTSHEEGQHYLTKTKFCCFFAWSCHVFGVNPSRIESPDKVVTMPKIYFLEKQRNETNFNPSSTCGNKTMPRITTWSIFSTLDP